jgi:hypothetical protein
VRLEACSAASTASGETLPGKAPEARYWVLLEHPRPWPARAEDAAPPELVRQVAELGSARLGLIRRRGSRATASRVVLVDTAQATSAAGSPSKLGALLGELRPAQPMLLVCIHAQRDACCGRLGTPVAAALAARYPGLTWETSHIGGHRLAANLVCLPHGYVFSRLTVPAALEAAGRYLEGRVLLDACRGRSSLAPAAQAGELFARRSLDFDRLDGFDAPPSEVRAVSISPAALTSCRGERGPLVNYEPV